MRFRREGGDRGVVEPVRPDEFDVVVGLERVADGSGVREGGGNVEEPEAGGVVSAGRVDVLRGPAHDLEQLRSVEVGSHSPDPGRSARYERSGEARTVAGS